MNDRRPMGLATAAALGLAFCLLTACSEQHDPNPKDIPQPALIPVTGAPAFTVVSDKTVESRKETAVRAVLVVPKGTTYTPLQPLLKGIYPQVALRTKGFHYRKNPNVISVKVYDDQAKAAAGGDGALAELRVTEKAGAPEFITHIPLELDKQVARAVCPLPEFGKVLQPKITVDDAATAVTYAMPHVVPGEDKYAEKVDWGEAVTAWSNTVQKVFKGVPTLKSFTFVSELEGKELAKIVVTGEQLKELNLPQAEHKVADTLGNFAAVNVNAPNFEAKYKKEADKVRRQAFEPALAKLPKEQVTLNFKGQTPAVSKGDPAALPAASGKPFCPTEPEAKPKAKAAAPAAPAAAPAGGK